VQTLGRQPVGPLPLQLILLLGGFFFGGAMACSPVPVNYLDRWRPWPVSVPIEVSVRSRRRLQQQAGEQTHTSNSSMRQGWRPLRGC